MNERPQNLIWTTVPEDIPVRQWQEKYQAGAYASKDVDVQRLAGWWNWNCRSDALAGRLKLIAPVVMKIKDPFILDNYFVWFINTTAHDELVYDSIRFQPLDRVKDGLEFFKIDFRSPDESDLWTLYTQRFGLYAPEFSCGHVRDMAKYIADMAWEMEHGVKPPFLDEKAAAVEYILNRDTIRPARALRREGERSYSFQDMDDGKRKTVYVAAGLEDVPPGFQAEGAVQINGFYVSCPETEEEAPAIPAKSAKAAQKQKRGRTMQDKEMSVRQWQELYWAGTLREDDLAAQELADQDDFADPLNDRRLKSLCKLALAIAHPFILDNYRVFFSEGEPNVGSCYVSVGFYPLDKNRFQNLFRVDLEYPYARGKWALSTRRYGEGEYEFECGHVRQMLRYIHVMADELQQGIKPPFWAEMEAAKQFVFDHCPRYYNSQVLRREGEHSYSTWDQDTGDRVMLHVAHSPEDTPPGFQAQDAVLSRELYVFARKEPEKVLDLCRKKSRTKKEVER